MVLKEKLLFNKNIKICITGASGFIGSCLVDKLIASGYKVSVLTRNKKFKKNKNLVVYNGDLLKPNSKIDKFLYKCDILYHCAGELTNEKIMYQLHVDGTRNLLKKFAISPLGESKLKHFIQLSSVGAYGKFDQTKIRRVITEKSSENPGNIYELTKTISDKTVQEYSQLKNFFYTILRPTNVVGSNMRNYSFFSLIKSIVSKKFFYIGSSDSIMTYIHVDDVVDALILCAINSKAKNQIFILSNDCSLRDIVDCVIGNSKNKYSPKCLPEFFVRFITIFLSLFVKFPLTINRINYLVSKTTYSSKKIQKILNFLPKKEIPYFASSIINSKIKMKE